MSVRFGATDPAPAPSFAVLLDGDVTVTARLCRQIARHRVIAADGAIRHAKPLGVTPELWVGDFDSAWTALKADYAAIPQAAFERDKDRTDGEIAIDAALTRGARSLVLVGALGGRTDHATAHLLSAAALARRGIATLLTSGMEEAAPLTRTPYRPGWPAGTTFSVLAFSDLVGLTLTGARWPLAAQTVPLGSTLTLSNETTGTLSASVETGAAVLIGQL